MRSLTAIARLEASGLDQLVEEFRLVHDLVIAAEVRILIFQIVEAMRALRDDAPRLVAIERLDVLPRHRRIEVFVAEPARRIAGAHFFLAQNGEFYACLFHQAGE